MPNDPQLDKPPLYICLDDEPYSGAAQHPRTRATVDLLTNKLRHYAAQAKDQRAALRIGLFGGYGQGKSGVALAVQETLQQQGYRVWRLDISDYLPDELEYGFDALIAGRSPFKVALALLFVGLLAAPIFSSTNPSIQTASLLVTGLAGWTMLKPLWLGIRRWFYLFGAAGKPAAHSGSKQQYWREHIASGVKGCFRLSPDVLIVDDLDRARVEQQKSLLRALYKLSGNLKFAALVCMDETALLHSAPTPDDPAEFLRKVVHFELRLPPREQADFVLTAMEACAQAKTLNPASPLVHYLENGDFLCALARVLCLLPNPSPRRAKHLLNDVLGRAAWLMAEANNEDKAWLYVEDVVAMLRLNGLLELAPELREETLALVDLLETNADSAMQAVMDARLKDDGRKARARRFFAATRHMQPVSSWRALLTNGAVRWRNTSPPSLPGLLRPGEDVCGDKAAFYRYCQLLRHFFHGIGYCLDERASKDTPKKGDDKPEFEHLVQRLQNNLNQHRVHAWMVFHTIIAGMNDAVARLRLYRYFQAQTETPLLPNETSMPAALYRLWLADAEALALLGTDELHHCLERLQAINDAAYYAIVGLLPVERTSWGLAQAVVLFPAGIEARDAVRTRRWLGRVAMLDPSIQYGTKLEPLPLAEEAVRGERLSSWWPAIAFCADPELNLELLRQQLSLWRQDGLGWQGAPAALQVECWRLGRLQQLMAATSVAAVLRVLHVLLQTPEGHWDTTLWQMLCVGHVAESQALLENSIIDVENLTRQELHTLMLLLAGLESMEGDLSNSSEIMYQFHAVNQHHISDITLLRVLLEPKFSGFWLKADINQLQVLLKQEVYEKLGDTVWRELLNGLFSQHRDNAACYAHFFGDEHGPLI